MESGGDDEWVDVLVVDVRVASGCEEKAETVI